MSRELDFTIRDARPEDGETLLAMLPRLADFKIPARREPRHLWQDDEKLLKRWLAGEADQCFVQVAEDDAGLLGMTMTSLRPELLSHVPAAHLEAIVVERRGEGRGIGRALLAAAETRAQAEGAQYLTLHVFAVNSRARTLYERCGYDGELVRYIKALD